MIRFAVYGEGKNIDGGCVTAAATATATSADTALTTEKTTAAETATTANSEHNYMGHLRRDMGNAYL